MVRALVGIVLRIRGIESVEFAQLTDGEESDMRDLIALFDVEERSSARAGVDVMINAIQTLCGTRDIMYQPPCIHARTGQIS